MHSAWLRDQTWPVGALAPEPDDELLLPDVPLPPAPVIEPASATSSGISTSWTLVGGPEEAHGEEAEER